nr:hypothetical protein [Achromobacter xylosoxidans]
MQFRSGHASRQGGRVRLARADLRQPATRLHAAVDRRGPRPALGPDQGASGLNAQEYPYSPRRTPHATPRRHTDRADRQ